ncbi:MAG TPA: type II toxin-antitoxin system RelE/ParE family toxin [Actinomycetota bacterium]|nr:type II toxin-antitoxin system RelE/ParE family toxin [Actinomycetota bacterium]
MARSASRALALDLPEAVAPAVVEFVTGALLEHPQRVGRPLQPPLDGKWSARRGQYRIIYTIDGTAQVVTVLHISHRRDAYR